MNIFYLIYVEYIEICNKKNKVDRDTKMVQTSDDQTFDNTKNNFLPPPQ